jgi:hypothetical protein
MERMHMWSSFKILIEDLRLSSNVTYVSNLIAIYSKGNFLDFLIDFFADFTPMFYL